MASHFVQFEKSLAGDERAQLICMVLSLASHLGCMVAILPNNFVELQQATLDLSRSAIEFVKRLPE